MRPPVPQINNLMKEKKSKIDRTSKIFILTELICGVNRVPVLSNIKPIFIILSFIFSLSINITTIYFGFYDFSFEIAQYLQILKLTQYLVCVVLGFAFRKRLRDFYSTLSAFDSETDFGGEIRDVTKNVVQTCLTIGFTSVAHIILKASEILDLYYIDDVIILLVHIGELHYFGHLLSLLIPRLRFIRLLMKASFKDSGIKTIETDMIHVINRKQSCDIRKLMDCYHRMIVAFDTLYDATKWQAFKTKLVKHLYVSVDIKNYTNTDWGTVVEYTHILLNDEGRPVLDSRPQKDCSPNMLSGNMMLCILVTTFLRTLCLSYLITLNFIHNDYEVTNVLLSITLAVIEMAPMFAPCRVVDAVHGEALCLIELLSSKLYENKIEKSSRTVAQALLALMEARDLSLSLLRIFDIDISFPFKFLGLLVTYLIILLQFEKVINLDRSLT